MHVTALPGRNAQTESWLLALLSAVPLPTDGLVRYRHWTSDADASVDFEAGCLHGRSPDLVIAKSFGTVVASTAFVDHGFRPAAAVLIGTPFAALGAAEVSKLKAFARDVDMLFIQQTADPGGASSALAGALELTRGDVADVPGDDHLYPDVALLADLIRARLASRVAQKFRRKA